MGATMWYTRNNKFVTTHLKPDNMHLHLNSRGQLKVKYADGTVAWDSCKDDAGWGAYKSYTRGPSYFYVNGGFDEICS